MHKCDDLYSSIDININTLSSQKKVKVCIQHSDGLDIIMWSQKKNEGVKILPTQEYKHFGLKTVNN